MAWCTAGTTQPTPQLQPRHSLLPPLVGLRHDWPAGVPILAEKTAHTSAVLRASPRSCKWARSDDGLIVLIVPTVSATCIGRSEVLRPAQAVLPLSPARQGRKRCWCCWLWALIMHGRKDSESVAQGLYEVQLIFKMWFFTGISFRSVVSVLIRHHLLFSIDPEERNIFFLWIGGSGSLFDKTACGFILCPPFKFVMYVNPNTVPKSWGLIALLFI